MKIKYLCIVSLFLSCAIALESGAKISMSPLFTDNMVLQQKTYAPVWGTASPGDEISVITSWNNSRYTTVAGDDGKWMLRVRTTKAGGPYSMTISDGSDEKVISNILLGEVWLCSGQSNMEMPVKGWGKVNDYEMELKNAARYPQIRFLTVRHDVSPVPLEEFSAVGDGWLRCSPESLEEFSATAYFFGREIHLEEDVPVGLINTSWGGTVIETWMSYGALNGVDMLGQEAIQVAAWPVDKEERRRVTDEAIKQWNRMISEIDHESISKDTLFKAPVSDIYNWYDIAIPGFVENVFQAFDGHMLLRREVEIPQSWIGQDIVLNIRAVDDRDLTYFNGELIGATAGWDAPRRYEIPGKLVKDCKADIAMHIIDERGDGGVSGAPDSFYLEGPDGRRVSLSGNWKIKVDVDYRTLPIYPVNMSDDPNWTNLLYNAMIHPLVPFAIKGAIWYQGCSNSGRAYQYRELMPLLINDWRNIWGYDFPFYLTQLANFMERRPSPGESEWAELREAQTLASRTVAKSGMAVAIDIGDAMDIHPKNKQEVGRRLALQALSKTYGRNSVCSGPVYEGYTIEGNSILIHFSSIAKGLKIHGDKLEGFAVSGADRQFHWAEAVIEGDCVRVTCDNVPMPLAVRYAWADNPACNLYNSEGLPAGPFRTDDWPGLTIGKTTIH